MRNAIILTQGHPSVVARVTNMAQSRGYWFEMPPPPTAMAIRLVAQGSSSYSNRANPYPVNSAEYPSALYPIRLDAFNNMAEVMQFFGNPLSLEGVVGQDLARLIRSSPSLDLVAGFIRRDLGLVLPPEVQAQGSQAISDWILAQMTPPTPPAPLPVAEPAPPSSWAIT